MVKEVSDFERVIEHVCNTTELRDSVLQEAVSEALGIAMDVWHKRLTPKQTSEVMEIVMEIPFFMSRVGKTIANALDESEAATAQCKSLGDYVKAARTATTPNVDKTLMVGALAKLGLSVLILAESRMLARSESEG